MKIWLFFKLCCLAATLVSFTAFARPKLQTKQFKTLKSLDIHIETNIPGFQFQGHLKEPQPIKKGQLVIPHKQLTTEMGLRDQHMYKKIFKGQDIVFKGIAKCYKNIKCKVVGKLTIAGHEKKLKLLVKKSGKNFEFTHKIKLTDFSIEIPEFTGVRVENEIAITARIR